MKRLILSLSAAAALAGCAGGSGVAKHDVDVTIPTLNAVNPSKILGDATNGSGTPIAIDSLHTGSGSLQYSKISVPNPYFPWDDEVNRFLYVAPDGTKYSFENPFTGPVLADRYGEQNPNVPNKHTPQPTANGGKLFACCEEADSSFTPAYLQSTRYGAWISPSGQADLFVAGIPAPINDMQRKDGATSPTGKATYTVWALRVKDGSIVSSSHSNAANTDVHSLITVNFNTGKVGGTIKGNADFGPDINFGDVSVDGNRFGGSVTSGGAGGQVDGRFFGTKPTPYSSTPSGTEIGGKITFDGNHHLDSVFGGRVKDWRSRKADDTSTDLTPLPQ